MDVGAVCLVSRMLVGIAVCGCVCACVARVFRVKHFFSGEVNVVI